MRRKWEKALKYAKAINAIERLYLTSENARIIEDKFHKQVLEHSKIKIAHRQKGDYFRT